MIVCSGRLPGASTVGEAGSSEKPKPRSCRQTPVPGATMPLPKRLVERVDQRAAVALGVDRAQVGRVAGPAAGGRAARPRRAAPASSSATGTSTNSGSPTCACSAANACRVGLGLEVDALRAQRVERAEVLALERAQDHQRGDRRSSAAAARGPRGRGSRRGSARPRWSGARPCPRARGSRRRPASRRRSARRSRPRRRRARPPRRACRACARGRAGARARPRAARGRRAGTRAAAASSRRSVSSSAATCAR